MLDRKAFSLIELTVVITVISILIISVIAGQGLVSTSALISAKSLTKQSIVREIDGLIAWYETSTPASIKKEEGFDNGQITTWHDISPDSINEKKNTLSKVASSTVIYRKNGINNIPSIEFAGVDNAVLKLESFWQGSLSSSTILLVLQPANLSAAEVVIDSYSTNTSHIAISPTYLRMRASANGINANTIVASDTPHILAGYFNGNLSKFYLNDATNIAGGATINPGSNPLTGLTVGGYMTASNPEFHGYISEIIIFNRPLKKVERIDVMSYLSKKYNIRVLNLKN